MIPSRYIIDSYKHFDELFRFVIRLLIYVTGNVVFLYFGARVALTMEHQSQPWSFQDVPPQTSYMAPQRYLEHENSTKMQQESHYEEQATPPSWSPESANGSYHPRELPKRSFLQGSPFSASVASCGDSCMNNYGCDISNAVPISPGFPNYDRWTQQNNSPNTWQVLPYGLIFPSYLAGLNEPRLAAVWNYERHHGWMWDATAGGRMGVLRYGSKQRVLPEGFQIDVEGAAQVRLDYECDMDVLATDYRCGVPITFGTKRTQFKTGYYHVSSHLGDEYQLRADARNRINYVRDSLIFAIAHRPHQDVRIYAEAAVALHTGEKTDPWEFQFGAEYSQIYPANQPYGSPFIAFNVHLLQELDFGGNINLQIGWQWRGPSNRLFRAGIQYFDGASDQFEFQDLYERKIGIGLWGDF